MAKESSKKSFLDFFKVKDLDDDEFDDDLFDDDDDDEEDDDDDDYMKPAKKAKPAFGRSTQSKPQTTYKNNSYSNNGYNAQAYKTPTQNTNYSNNYNSYTYQTRAQAKSVGGNNKLVDFNSGKQQYSNNRGSSDVYVIKPHEISESQTVVDFLNKGKTIVINMEGLELTAAQRIIDFIGGACYAISGSLQAISANIFIAAPGNIEVSGDLREEILNESTVSPQLGRY